MTTDARATVAKIREADALRKAGLPENQARGKYRSRPAPKCAASSYLPLGQLAAGDQAIADSAPGLDPHIGTRDAQAAAQSRDDRLERVRGDRLVEGIELLFEKLA